MKKFALILVLAIAGSGVRADLPNSCTILATEAHARLERAGVWTRVLNVFFVEVSPNGSPIPTQNRLGHSMVVWQLKKNGRILIYDDTGTRELKTCSRDEKDIIAEIAALNPDKPTLSGHFVD